MISVVMPVYNCQSYIREAIESVLTQSYKEYEFIIVDDGSTDDTPQIVGAYSKQDTRIRFIRSEHRGISYALNMGIRRAQYNMIARMDGDDVCEPARFERQMQYMNEHPETDVLGTYISEVIGEAPAEIIEKKINGFNYELNHANIEYYLLNEYLLFHPSWLFKKAIFDCIGGYNNKYDGVEDYDFLLRAYRSGFVIRNLSEGLIKLRLSRDSASRISYGGKPESVRRLIHLKLDFLDERIDFGTKRIAIWGAGSGGVLCREVLRARYPDIQIICFYDKFKDGQIDGVPVYATHSIDFNRFDIMVGATEPGKREIFNFMEANGKNLYENFIILTW